MAKMTIKQRLSIIADGRHLNLADIVAADALAEIKRLESIIRKIKCPASPPDVEAIGFAVMSFGKINVTTVSPTRRGALVNWLVSSARIPVFQWTTDDEIESSWRQLSGRDHKCAEVSIAALLDGGRKP